MTNPLMPHQPPGTSRSEVEVHMRDVRRSIENGPRRN
jgi:hypothetical protein